MGLISEGCTVGHLVVTKIRKAHQQIYRFVYSDKYILVMWSCCPSVMLDGQVPCKGCLTWLACLV